MIYLGLNACPDLEGIKTLGTEIGLFMASLNACPDLEGIKTENSMNTPRPRGV